ncbi:MAG: alpha-1,2-fucosyltransferase [Lachnospiraceae bacterium]|jgi:hypothetical protein|nr:alpha-1,2-fucosyltransferase [Lachnospiraceae bacterium]
MKVMHIDSGLGNQMLAYCELLAYKKANPEDDFYIETMVYDIEQACRTISQWNGYELDKVFGIKEKNIKDLFDELQWQRILSSVIRSKFWDDNWRYSDAICGALNTEGINLNNIYSRPHKPPKKELLAFMTKTRAGYFIKRKLYTLLSNKVIDSRNMYIKSSTNDYIGPTLQFSYKNRGIELLDREIRQVFSFRDIEDEYNKNMSKMINYSDSVAIHARRGDMLSANGHYYKFGYFKRAVKFIQSRVPNPTFFFFCDPGNIEWVKRNLSVFGLKSEEDNIQYVNGNTSDNSFRDMQLMTQCKHAVITNSSFGFWGAYLIDNKNKITCSPDIRINTTHNF